MSDDFDSNNDFNNDNDDYGQKPMGFFKGKYVGKSYDANFEFGNFRKKSGSGGNGDAPNGNNNDNNNNGKNNGGKNNGFMFWVVFIFLFFVSAALFAVSKISIIGWVLLIIIFAIAYFLKNFLSKRGCLINIIIWVIILFLIFIVFAFTLPKDTSAKPSSGSQTPAASAKVPSASSNASNSGLKNLQFSKTYNFPNNKGYYTLKVLTEGKSYVIKIYVQVPKEIVPAGSKYDPITVTEKVNYIQGDERYTTTAHDMFGVCWKSVGVPVERQIRNAPLPFTKYDNSTDRNVLKDYAEATLTASANSLEALKALMRAGDTVDVFWYNVKEVGITDVKIDSNNAVSGVIMQWKGYGLHPNLVSAEIPWDAIMTELGIK